MRALTAVRTGSRPQGAPTPTPAARIALLGTGTVGRAVLARLADWEGTTLGARLSLAYVANSREAVRATRGADGHDDASCSASAMHALPGCAALAPCASDLSRVEEALDSAPTRIVIDATAREAVAGRHARWLAQGIHVVTACKLGQGAALARWRAIRAASAAGAACYGDSATVGAGLPLLRSLRELQAGGDRIHAVAGVLSGSLAWLFDQYDGMRPFSALVRQARAAGYTEPDPRDDLSGEDVRRKLLILARAAGAALEPDQVGVGSLVPPALAALPAAAVDTALPALDGALRARFATAWKEGARLRFVARLDLRGAVPLARVGLEALAAGDPLAGGSGTDNRVAIWSDRYLRQPLVVQGPGAGAGVTAAALLDDALRIAG
ncbi:MAG TPA: homoserine dehydrogenase [Xanthomonadaceae bacterium]|nr:homoserine dehydrogenase [Xanthomonadaceae bacterium]